VADTPLNALQVLTPKPAGRYAGGLCIVESGSAESDNNRTAKTDAPSCGLGPLAPAAAPLLEFVLNRACPTHRMNET
jgi:hypothetical protein